MTKNKLLHIEIRQSIFLRHPIVTFDRHAGVRYYNSKTPANLRRIERLLDTYLHSARIDDSGTSLSLHISFDESDVP